jgi:hypothetical protein
MTKGSPDAQQATEVEEIDFLQPRKYLVGRWSRMSRERSGRRSKPAGSVRRHVLDFVKGVDCHMTMSGEALKRLKGSFSDLCVCKDMLVVLPTEHIIKCFVFERTPYKGLFYFWRVVLPLYTPFPILTLGYGRRLARGGYIDLGGAEFEQSVAHLAGIISQGELEDLRSIRSPQNFLDRFGGPAAKEGYTPGIYAFHAALTYYLVGNMQLCIDILEEFASEDIYPGRAKYHLCARDLAREMRLDSLAAARKIRSLEISTIKRFALAPTITPARLEEYGLLKRQK